MGRPLDELFRDVLRRYPIARRDEKFGRGSTFWPLITELKAELDAVPSLVSSRRTKVKVSFGQGGWADVPNFALMDTRETERPSAGIYMVYLVRADASGIVLSLNQGSADLIFEAKGRAYDVLRARASKVREALSLDEMTRAGFVAGPIDLKSTGQYPRAYAAGSIVSQTYSAETIPSAEALAEHLAALHRAYQSVIPSSRLRLGDAGSRWRA